MVRRPSPAQLGIAGRYSTSAESKQALTLNAPFLPPDSVLSNRSDLNMTRRLTNQDAFDGAMLHLLNQGHSCLSASGQARYRGPRGKSAIGALIPDELYVTSIEGKKLHHWLAAGPGIRRPARAPRWRDSLFVG